MVAMRVPIAVMVAMIAAACGSSAGVPSDGAMTDGTSDASNPADAAPPMVTVNVTNHPIDTAAYAFFVAYEDGDGEWALAPRGAGTTYAFPVVNASGRYGIAVGCISNWARKIDLFYATVAELSIVPETIVDCGDNLPAQVNLSGSVTGTNGEPTYVTFGGDVSQVSNGNYSMTVAAGTHDLFAVRGNTRDDVVVMRDVRATADTTVDIDFAASGIAPVTYAASLQVDAGEQGVVWSDLHQPDGGGANLSRLYSAPYSFNALAIGSRLDSDRYAVTGWSYSSTAGRLQTITTVAPGDVVFALPAHIANPQFTVVTTQPEVRIEASWAPYADAEAFTFYVNQYPSLWNVKLVTKGWLAGTTSIEMPSLAGLPGWDARYALKTGTLTGVALAACHTTGPVTDFFTWPTMPGAMEMAVAQSSVTP